MQIAADDAADAVRDGRGQPYRPVVKPQEAALGGT